ncbi:ribose-phosphate diphosphokinase [Massilia sp. X63]|uniref:ribose-phosphate diphosphokinase n=1 Tax=Massilia sp. X63 TaxID=3237285 RepID=UPI0034DD4755
MKPILFALPGNEAMGAELCRLRGWEAGDWEVRSFPDGETHIRYLSEVAGREVILVCSLDRPNARVVPLYLAAGVARELGARRIGLVVPYLAYMRQDARFHSGEGVTARHFAGLLGRAGDWLVTVDPHLHRIHRLDEIYGIPSRVVAAAPAIAAWVVEHVGQPLLIGPDEESEQWVAQVAAAADCPYTVLRKVRRGDRDVSVSAPELAGWRERTPVLVDDIASTARTLIAAVGRLREAGMPPPVCVAVHPLFVGEAYAELLAAGVAEVACTDTIAHRCSRIGMAAAIGDAADALSACCDGVGI